MRVRAFIAALCSSFLLFSAPAQASAAVQLPDGAVKGLPSDLTAMDSEGNAVSSSTGEYFFHVEDMTFGETYTKDVQLMNLREDKAYHIYFYVEPVSKNGEIDLEEEVECTMSLDGVQFFEGNVNGKGNIDLTEEIQDLGYYEPGDSHTLSCSVVRSGLDEDMLHIDEGSRIVTDKGITIVRDKNGDRHVEGEIIFKWIFYAAVDEEFEPPDTGFLSTKDRFWALSITGSAVLVAVMALLLLIKKRRKRSEEQQ
ncbi:hypothetical protein [Ruminococcus sp.]|uniref:hypothetical protein n=1 Tax=Ruminococcus sp. TaxID=41978 RepID=UPI002BD65903|nr:hypothetical protein [Ruminococcus sp.]HNZ99173.1 hypothetical protein [Ruminococcus sp.]